MQYSLNIRGLFLNTDFFYIIDKKQVYCHELGRKKNYESQEIQTHQPLLLRLEGGLYHSTQGKIEYDTALIEFFNSIELR